MAPRGPASWSLRLRQLKQLADPATFFGSVLVVAGALIVLVLPGWVAGLVLWAGWAWVVGEHVTWARARTPLVRLSERPAALRDGWLRIVLVVAATSLAIDSWATASPSGGAPSPWWGFLVGAFAVVVLLLEAELRPHLRNSTPLTANLPGGALPVPSGRALLAFYWLNTGGVAVWILVSVLGLPPWIALLLPLAAFAAGALLAAQVVRYLNARRRLESRLPGMVRKLGPLFVVHWRAPAGSAYQIRMWLPYLSELGVPFCVVVRTVQNFEEVASMTDAPVLLRPGLADLDAVLTPSLRAVFYVNASSDNSQTIRFAHLTHIQLNHGDSDKVASVSPVFRQYDRNFVAGQAAIDRFAKHGVDLPPGQMEIVGRPQLERVRTQDGRPTESPTVLYAPTWSGFYEDSDYSSLPAGPQIVDGLLKRGATVIFRPHPSARKRASNAANCDRIVTMLSEDAAAKGRAHVFGAAAETELDVVECFNASDAMICDVSSLASDYLASGKPFAMTAVSAHGEEFLAEFPLAEGAYVIDVEKGSASGLDDALDHLLRTDPKRTLRRELRGHYLAGAPSEYGSTLFAEAAGRHLSA